ncbi:hypothetical protein NSK_004541 [Nannochloropsis salina CCMP1776]|uniref:histone acetyltransferase n=1 Tax=Nannochloropsis salina CCMP1776 TaxID=1027361 RepID=A0A4D9D604_9STRA|nr:hypothetical protein NSK_004541 [Nannochloropsis salina CCMP1776]|eukprot:TFJ84068.1 hypothetical protein NSK_004541 [Nannochloropsis salina CCMP1776]
MAAGIGSQTGTGQDPPAKKNKQTHPSPGLLYPHLTQEGHKNLKKEEDDIDLASSDDEEDEMSRGSDALSLPPAQDAITFTLHADSMASSTTTSAFHGATSMHLSPQMWSFHPEFTHQFFEDEVLPPGYPDLAIEMAFNAATGEWSLHLTYDEAAARAGKSALQASSQELSQTAGPEDDTVGTEGSDEPSLQPFERPPLCSSNGGDDVPLLRCLLPCVPHEEGCACSINGKEGWLLPARGFVSVEEGKAAGPKRFQPGIKGRAARVAWSRHRLSLRFTSPVLTTTAMVLSPQRPPLPPPRPPPPSSSPPSPPAIANLHRRFQKWAPWFIENGDDVNPEGGDWELLYLTARPPPPRLPSPSPFLVGYLTLFSFSNPIKGKCLRLCQILVLPPFQRRGHGQRLLREAWRVGREREVVYELTVEDPAPGFKLLRSVNDLQDVRAWRRGEEEEGGREEGGRGLGFGSREVRMPERGGGRPGPCLSSVHREEREREGGREEGRKGGKEDGRHRCFRLMVKRRLAREMGGDFEGKKEELRAYLDEKFRERVEELETVCRKAGVWEEGREGAAGGE